MAVPDFPLAHKIILLVLEPLSLIVAFFSILADPVTHIKDHSFLPSNDAIDANSITVTKLLANMYLLAAITSAAVYYTAPMKTIKAFLCALLAFDIGHLVFFVEGLGGYEGLVRWREWNPYIWSTMISVPVLILARSTFVLGLVSTGETTGMATEKAKKTA